jgi:hypothetical protein
MADPTDARMYDAIEAALWQDLADALNRLSEYGLDPIAGLCDQLGAKPTTVIDAGTVIHGGGVRKPGEGYLLRYQSPFSRESDSDPWGWVVKPRAEEGQS